MYNGLRLRQAADVNLERPWRLWGPLFCCTPHSFDVTPTPPLTHGQVVDTKAEADSCSSVASLLWLSGVTGKLST